jgi:hypothetical protein
MEKKNIMRRKLYTAMFKLEVVDFAKEKGDRGFKLIYFCNIGCFKLLCT